MRLVNISVKSDETYLKSISPDKNEQIDAVRSVFLSANVSENMSTRQDTYWRKLLSIGLGD